MLQSLALDISHGNEGMALDLADFINGGYIGMINRCRGSRFAHQPGLRMLLFQPVTVNELQRHLAT